MKRFILPAILLGAALLLVAAVPAGAKPGRDFIGRWLATDIDDSNMELWITRSGWSGGRLLNLRARDDRTLESWCGGHARMEAIGVLVEDYSLETSGAWWCLDPAENILFPLSSNLIYDPLSDTIGEGDVTWHRAP
jgi:hypothetical protein